jgi:hypothetical protein
MSTNTLATLLDRLAEFDRTDHGDWYWEDAQEIIAAAAQVVLPNDNGFLTKIDGGVWRIMSEDRGSGQMWHADEVEFADKLDGFASHPEYPALVVGLPTRG